MCLTLAHAGLTLALRLSCEMRSVAVGSGKPSLCQRLYRSHGQLVIGYSSSWWQHGAGRSDPGCLWLREQDSLVYHAVHLHTQHHTAVTWKKSEISVIVHHLVD